MDIEIAPVLDTLQVRGPVLAPLHVVIDGANQGDVAGLEPPYVRGHHHCLGRGLGRDLGRHAECHPVSKGESSSSECGSLKDGNAVDRSRRAALARVRGRHHGREVLVETIIGTEVDLRSGKDAIYNKLNYTIRPPRRRPLPALIRAVLSSLNNLRRSLSLMELNTLS